MPLKELLLKSTTFTQLLKQYSINPADFVIKDEDLILSEKRLGNEDVFKEVVLIQGKSDRGRVNLIGTLHCNFLKNIAVFELESADLIKEDVAGV